MKAEFLNDEIWILTFGGGFQRANIYKSKNISAEGRKEFRQALRNHIEEIVDAQYHDTVSEEKHMQNIQSVVDVAKNLKIEGHTIPINYGVSQKLLNLYLKYSWCSGKIKEKPVHFPVDRLIQTVLIKKGKDLQLTNLTLKPWTQFENKKDYKIVIDFAKEIRDHKYPGKALAEMELEIFERR